MRSWCRSGSGRFPGSLASENLHRIHLGGLPPRGDRGYGIDATTGEALGFSAAVTVRLTGRHDSVGWVSFDLLESLVVDSVVDGRGRPVEFFRAKNSDELWVRFGPVTRPGDPEPVEPGITQVALADHCLRPTPAPTRSEATARR